MKNKGFTLVEVLIAVALVAILLSTVYGVFTSVAGAKQRLESEGEGYHQARVFFDRLGRELRGAYFDPQKQKTFFIGRLSEEELPLLNLTTTSGTPYGGRQGGINIVSYELLPDRESPVGDEILVLMRDERSVFALPGDNREGYRLATGLRDVKFRYYRDGEWHDEYDARQNGNKLPQMVELTLSLPVEGRLVPFRTTYEIPLAK